MALGGITKQIAQQAILSVTDKATKETPAPTSPGAVVLGQIAAMQKPLREDEELVVMAEIGGEKIRVFEIFLPSPQVVVLIGVDSNRAGTRVVSAIEALQLICRTAKLAAGAKPSRISLVSPKA